MYIMYVDEAGVEEVKDKTQYFIISGVVIHENDLEKLREQIIKLSWHKFPEKFRGNEIHIHNIFKGKEDFKGIDKVEIESLLTKIYELINVLYISKLSPNSP